MQETKPKKLPQEGELVVGTVTKVFPYGAFVKLEEYPGHNGMIHVSEIASKWVKNIRDYVKEGQRVVVKVLKIDPEKGHIDLSLKSVKSTQKKNKTEEHKREQRAMKLIELVGNKLKDKENVKKVTEILEANFEGLFPALETIVKNGDKALEGIKLPEKWSKTLVKTAQEHIEIPKVSVTGILELESRAPNGVEVIREALSEAFDKYNVKESEIILKYLGAPKYQIFIKGDNYKVIENCLNNFSNDIIEKLKAAQGSGKLTR